MKVLLANLPWQRQGRWGVRAGSRWPHIKDENEGGYLPFPFFLSYAASLLQAHGIETILIDAIAEQIPENDFLNRVTKIDCDYLVCETSVPSFYEDLSILKKISSIEIPIILCGPNFEIYHEEFLKQNPYIDFVLCGEYEYTLLELMESLQGAKGLSGVAGLIYRNNGAIIKNAKREPFDINILPWPHRDSLPMHKYLDAPCGMPTPSVQMLASRGCPFGCNFCLWPQVFYQGNHYRTRHIKDVVDEMEYLVIKKKFKSVYFDDDTFNVGKKRMLEFCNEIIKRNLNNIPWAIMAKADLMDEQILGAMKKAGLYSIKYGVESGSQELLDGCGKSLDLKRAEHIIKHTKLLGIKVHLTFCFGLPGETEQTVAETIDYSLNLKADSIQFSIVTPFPGTKLFKDLDKDGKISTKNWSLYDGQHSCVFYPDNISYIDLEKAKNYAYKRWLDYDEKRKNLCGSAKKFFACWKTNGLYKALGKAAVKTKPKFKKYL